MFDKKIQQNIPLAPLTTFKIGGQAKFFIEIRAKEDLMEAIDWGKKRGEEIFILGGGSNILVNDDGIEGLVIKLGNNNTEARGDRIESGSGELLSKINILASGKKLSGLEWSVGIPGTIGGAVRGNAGAYGFNIGEIVEMVEVYNLEKKQFEKFSKKDCAFGYRDSIFKYDKNLVIWSVVLKMENDASGKMKDKIAEYVKSRIDSQPKLPSAGCIFKNLTFETLENRNSHLADEAKSLGKVKNGMVGAGWVIEFLGLKGKTMGGAKISLEHGNFIVNTGKATASDVVMLISYIKQQVRDRLGIQLVEEVQYFGL